MAVPCDCTRQKVPAWPMRFQQSHQLEAVAGERDGGHTPSGRHIRLSICGGVRARVRPDDGHAWRSSFDRQTSVESCKVFIEKIARKKQERVLFYKVSLVVLNLRVQKYVRGGIYRLDLSRSLERKLKSQKHPEHHVRIPSRFPRSNVL